MSSGGLGSVDQQILKPKKKNSSSNSGSGGSRSNSSGGRKGQPCVNEFQSAIYKRRDGYM